MAAKYRKVDFKELDKLPFQLPYKYSTDAFVHSMAISPNSRFVAVVYQAWYGKIEVDGDGCHLQVFDLAAGSSLLHIQSTDPYKLNTIHRQAFISTAFSPCSRYLAYPSRGFVCVAETVTWKLVARCHVTAPSCGLLDPLRIVRWDAVGMLVRNDESAFALKLVANADPSLSAQQSNDSNHDIHGTGSKNSAAAAAAAAAAGAIAIDDHNDENDENDGNDDPIEESGNLSDSDGSVNEFGRKWLYDIDYKHMCDKTLPMHLRTARHHPITKITRTIACFTMTPNCKQYAYTLGGFDVDCMFGFYLVEEIGKPKRVMDGGHKGAIVALAISPDGKFVVSGGGYDDNEIRLWKPNRKKPTMVYKRSQPVTELAWSPNGLFVAAQFAENHDLRIFLLAESKLINFAEINCNLCHAFSPVSSDIYLGHMSGLSKWTAPVEGYLHLPQLAQRTSSASLPSSSSSSNSSSSSSSSSSSGSTAANTSLAIVMSKIKSSPDATRAEQSAPSNMSKNKGKGKQQDNLETLADGSSHDDDDASASASASALLGFGFMAECQQKLDAIREELVKLDPDQMTIYKLGAAINAFLTSETDALQRLHSLEWDIARAIRRVQFFKDCCQQVVAAILNCHDHARIAAIKCRFADADSNKTANHESDAAVADSGASVVIALPSAEQLNPALDRMTAAARKSLASKAVELKALGEESQCHLENTIIAITSTLEQAAKNPKTADLFARHVPPGTEPADMLVELRKLNDYISNQYRQVRYHDSPLSDAADSLQTSLVVFQSRIDSLSAKSLPSMGKLKQHSAAELQDVVAGKENSIRIDQQIAECSEQLDHDRELLRSLRGKPALATEVVANKNASASTRVAGSRGNKSENTLGSGDTINDSGGKKVIDRGNSEDYGDDDDDDMLKENLPQFAREEAIAWKKTASHDHGSTAACPETQEPTLHQPSTNDPSVISLPLKRKASVQLNNDDECAKRETSPSSSSKNVSSSFLESIHSIKRRVFSWVGKK